ncbi:MAG: helix-turn-helix domain-containing protein, partial [Lachnospiraceae bacterium]|nr:helix-turn-helix domain-containing protein [Lachnospiraceae bacterium]
RGKMYRKCYPITAAYLDVEVAQHTPANEKWRIFRTLGDDLHILTRHISQDVSFAPLYIHRFSLRIPQQPIPEESVSLPPPEPDASIADKLRFYRCRKGLSQKRIAAYAGIHYTTYSRYENPAQKSYPLPVMRKIAELLEVPLTSLLDDYLLFLSRGQGKQIRELRKGLSLTQKEYADKLGISLYTLKNWEQETVYISRANWRVYFSTDCI